METIRRPDATVERAWELTEGLTGRPRRRRPQSMEQRSQVCPIKMLRVKAQKALTVFVTLG